MKNKILKTITAIAAIGFLLSASALDSDGFTVDCVCISCLIWLILFFIANRKRMLNKYD